MVGIAGKSKGCTTCRRRKVRCGQERPHCTNCIQSGRPCEGYERFPVFINRTIQGLQKRQPLEEAKPEGIPTNTVVLANRTAPGRLPAAPSAGNAWSANFLSWFWENYSPADGPSNSIVTGPVWLRHAMNVARPTEALHQSLLALSIVRRGRINHDEMLMNEGRHIYGRALRLLQKDLYDPKWVSHEETLAATRVMALYELYEATTNTAVSWQYHVSGLASLMQSRGPQSYGTPLARAVFEEFRYPLMIQSITLRKSYTLGEQVWRTVPWANTAKDKEQVLYDLGFSLAWLLEQTDVLARFVSDRHGTSGIELLSQVIKSSLQLMNALNRFKVNYFADSLILSEAFPYMPVSSAYQRAGFNFELENLVMTWWSLAVILSFTGKTISDLTHQITPRLSTSTLDSLKNSIEQLEDYYNDTDSNHIGRNVLATIETILQSNMGHFWFSRTIFPLTAATLQFYQSKPDMDLCERIKEQITRKKGFRFAQRLTSQPGVQITFADGPVAGEEL